MTHQAKKTGGIPPAEYTSLAKAWLFVYGVLYFCAAILGMKIVGWGVLGTLFLGLGGVLCWVSIYLRSEPFRLVLSVLWGFACVASWMKLVLWMPPYSDLQYTVMAVLNLVNALCLAYLGGVWKHE